MFFCVKTMPVDDLSTIVRVHKNIFSLILFERVAII